ncbi:MAG: isochorismatase family cysteine hydrolase [Pygmaiobacter sp.]
MKKILVVIDYQNDFVGGALGFPAAQQLEDGITALVEAALAEGTPVLFTRDTHASNYLDTREGKFLPVPHCIKNTEGWHLYGKLRAYEDHISTSLLDKPGFGSAGLPYAIQQLFGGDEPDEVTICGVVTNICVLCNAVILQTAFRNANIVIKKDLCAAVEDAHEQALAVMAGLGMSLD